MKIKRGISKNIKFYLILSVIVVLLFGVVYLMKPSLAGFVGYAIYEQGNQSEFDLGTYENTEYNGSAVVLSESNITGNYTSKVFDAGEDAMWNNLSKISNEPSIVSSIILNPTYAEDEWGGDITSYVEADDGSGTWERVEVQSWNNSLSLDYTIDFVIGYCDVLWIDNGAQIGFQTSRDNGTTWDSEVCVQDAVENTLFNCDLKTNSEVDTPGEINNLWMRCTQPTADSKDYYSTDWVFVDINFSSSTNLSYQIKNCSSSDCSDGTWQSADLNNLNLTGRYFQYKVELESPSSDETPQLNSVSIDYDLIDEQSPNISIVSPLNQTYNTESILINISASDVNLDSIWWYNGSENITYSSEVYYNFSEGSNTIIAYANDSSGNENSSSVTFNIVLNTAPTLNLVNPQNTLYISNVSIPLNYSVSDSDGNLNSCWYTLNYGETNTTLVDCGNSTFDVADGNSYTLIIYANDTNGEEVSDSASFNVDATGVAVSIIEPIGTKSSRTGISLQYTTTGENLTCWHNVKTSIGGSVIENTTLANCSNSSFDVSSDGDYVANLYINNSLGSSSNDNSSFSVDTSEDSGSTGSSGGGGGGSSTTTVQVTTQFTMQAISDISLKPGDSKKISVNVKNTGQSFLNSCELSGIGKYGSWVDGSDSKDLAIDESHDFIINVNVPEDVEKSSASVEVKLSCEETDKSTKFSVNIVEDKLKINLIEIKKVDENLEVVYSLKELSNQEQEVEIQLFLIDENNERVVEYSDIKNLGAGEEKQFSDILDIPIYLSGEHNLLINANSNVASTFIREDVLLGKSSPVGGLAILGDSNSDIFVNISLIILFFVFAFFSVKRINKLKKKKRKRRKKK